MEKYTCIYKPGSCLRSGDLLYRFDFMGGLRITGAYVHKNSDPIIIPDSIGSVEVRGVGCCFTSGNYPLDSVKRRGWHFSRFKHLLPASELNIVSLPQTLFFIGDVHLSGAERVELGKNILYTGNLSLGDDVSELVLPHDLCLCGDISGNHLKRISVGKECCDEPRNVTKFRDQPCRCSFKSASSCPELESVCLPDNIYTIYGKAFSNCLKLRNITLPAFVAEMPKKLFPPTEIKIVTRSYINMKDFPWGCVRCSISLENPPEKLRSGAFPDVKCLTGISFGKGLRDIHPKSFEGANQLKYIEFSEGLLYIGYGAFANATTNVKIPDSVCYIGAGAFNKCIKEALFANPGTQGRQSLDNYLTAEANKKENSKVLLAKATDFFTNKRYNETFRYAGEAVYSDGCNAPALALMARCYLLGYGTARDEVKGKECICKLERLGHQKLAKSIMEIVNNEHKLPANKNYNKDIKTSTTYTPVKDMPKVKHVEPIYTEATSTSSTYSTGYVEDKELEDNIRRLTQTSYVSDAERIEAEWIALNDVGFWDDKSWQ